MLSGQGRALITLLCVQSGTAQPDTVCIIVLWNHWGGCDMDFLLFVLGLFILCHFLHLC